VNNLFKKIEDTHYKVYVGATFRFHLLEILRAGIQIDRFEK
jgi:hypothetical protein